METPPRYDGGTCSTSGGRSQGGASSGGSSALPNASAPNAIAAPKYLRKRSSDEAFGANDAIVRARVAATTRNVSVEEMG